MAYSSQSNVDGSENDSDINPPRVDGDTAFVSAEDAPSFLGNRMSLAEPPLGTVCFADGEANGIVDVMEFLTVFTSTFPVMRLIRPVRIVTSSSTLYSELKSSRKHVNQRFWTMPTRPVAGDGDRYGRFRGNRAGAVGVVDVGPRTFGFRGFPFRCVAVVACDSTTTGSPGLLALCADDPVFVSVLAPPLLVVFFDVPVEAEVFVAGAPIEAALLEDEDAFPVGGVGCIRRLPGGVELRGRPSVRHVAYRQSKPDRMHRWHGSCPSHRSFLLEQRLQLLRLPPDRAYGIRGAIEDRRLRKDTGGTCNYNHVSNWALSIMGRDWRQVGQHPA